MKRYSSKEITLIYNNVRKGSTYKDICKLIYKDLDIIRTPNAIQQKCASLGIKSLNKQKLTNIEFVNILKEKNIRALSRYIGSNIKVKLQCNIDNTIWYTTPNSIINLHTGCPICNIVNRTKKHEQFIKEMSLINPNIEILSKYITVNTKIKCKCLIDQHVWEVIPDSLLHDHGCPVCAARNRVGLYQNMTKAELDVLPYPLYLYKVKLQFEDEIFYKFGLTMNEDRSRYKDYNPYKVIEELSFEELDAWTAKCKEAKLISNYEPIHHFGGWTECYT